MCVCLTHTPIFIHQWQSFPNEGKTWPLLIPQAHIFDTKIVPDEKDKEHREFKKRWHGLDIPTTGLYKPFNPMCSAAVQIIWSRFGCSPPAWGFWVARSALAVEHVQFHWTLAQITNHKKQGSGGLGLEQKEEPAVGWWSDHRLLVLW